MPPLNEYEYRPLPDADTVRLVVLHPAVNEVAPLTCSIATPSLAPQHPEYFAISYYWGDQKPHLTLEITEDGGNTSYLRITPNVDTVLRRFRVPRKRQFLWIDAVCLNQSDELEKAQQIPRMGRIYEQAKEVYIWLGPGHSRTAQTFRFFRKVSRLEECEKVTMSSRVAACLRKSFSVNEAVKGLADLIGFFEQPWFSRRWVIQEASLARHARVYCGKHSIPLATLSLATTRWQALDMSDYHFKMAACLGSVTSTVTTGTGMLLELLWNFHEAKCKDPRDRIAALHCLVPKQSRFPIDYTVHWAELYRQAASFLLATGTDNTKLQLLLHLFEFGPVGSATGSNCHPSWVPDWSKSRKRSLPYHSQILNVDTYEPYPASPGHPPLVSLSYTFGALRIHWNPSISGQVRLVRTHFGQPAPQDNQQRTEKLTAVLRDFFPLDDGQPNLHMLDLMALVRVVVEFRRFGTDKPLGADHYVPDMDGVSPGSGTPRGLNPVKGLAFILQEFSVFALQPLEIGSELCPRYGIGPREVQSGDIMIPIWRPLWKSDTFYIKPTVYERSVNAVTMLVVRPVTGGPVDTGDLQCKVIGPALCAMPSGGECHDGPVAGGPSWSELSTGDKESSLILV